MAGSSMDGLDVVFVQLSKNGSWTFEPIKSKSFSYPSDIHEMLLLAASAHQTEQHLIDERFGHWIAGKVNEMGAKDCDFVAVHGHTLIHDIAQKTSWQLGKAEVIAAETEMPVIADFRSEDLKLGGEGAPLVPVGDFELLSGYDACINLGGIANVSIRDSRLAWDISPCNQVLNFFSKKLGRPFDDEGKLARGGGMDNTWLQKVSQLSFFSLEPPKALINNYIPTSLLDEVDPLDGLHTFVSFLSNRIKAELSPHLSPGANVLLTGGGAYNTYLLEQLKSEAKGFEFIKPDDELIDFKEAIVFAFLGALRMRDDVNVLSTVTGASRDSSSGTIHFPK